LNLTKNLNLYLFFPKWIISGCGFGGLIFALAENFPDQYVMGMEIRGKVVNFVGEKIRAIRIES